MNAHRTTMLFNSETNILLQSCIQPGSWSHGTLLSCDAIEKGQPFAKTKLQRITPIKGVFLTAQFLHLHARITEAVENLPRRLRSDKTAHSSLQINSVVGTHQIRMGSQHRFVVNRCTWYNAVLTKNKQPRQANIHQHPRCGILRNSKRRNTLLNLFSTTKINATRTTSAIKLPRTKTSSTRAKLQHRMGTPQILLENKWNGALTLTLTLYHLLLFVPADNYSKCSIHKKTSSNHYKVEGQNNSTLNLPRTILKFSSACSLERRDFAKNSFPYGK